jgi:UDPglucose 6-dehydrogenase
VYIVVVGTGYVGLVTGTCFAEMGHEVCCVDTDPAKIESLRSGHCPIYEPGLDDLIRRNVAMGRLRFSTDLASVVPGSEAVFIAVGTPSTEDGDADLAHVLAAARQIGSVMESYLVVVTKSTVPVGTSELVTDAVREGQRDAGRAIDFEAASNPEFLKEGAAVDDFLRPDRVVIGVTSDRAREVLERIYRPFLLSGHPLMVMDTLSAEISKYASNAMLATRISFMNQIAALCDAVGADVNLVRKAMGTDPRIGSSFLFPGAGFGGSCFPKDLRALIRTGSTAGIDMQLLASVSDINEAQKHLPVRKLLQTLALTEDSRLDGHRVAVWGFSFKPNTDDVREAPALTVVADLLERGGDVVVYDPLTGHKAADIFGDRIRVAPDALSALDDADALILVTEWPEFRSVDAAQLAKRMRGRVIIDGRNVLDVELLAMQGFVIEGIGTRRVNAN